MSIQYDAIYLNQSRVPGQVRMSADGLGWKAQQQSSGSASRVSEPLLLPASELIMATWSRGSRGFLVRIQTRSGQVVQLDGFKQEEYNALRNALSHNLDLTLEHREHSMRGWNWGKAEFDRNEIVFNVAGRPDFELPYKDVANSNVVGKSEVAVELNLQSASEKTSAGDELVELRLYIPGNEEEEEAAQAFHETLQDKADIGAVTGSELASFAEVMLSTPRGRYDIALFEDAFRLHGKTYDYKVPYTSVQRIFVLPRLDDVHNSVVLQLDPPLRQGQTRYPFLVMQFARDEELEVQLNVDDEEFKAKYEGRVEKQYDELAYQVVSQLFKGMCNRKITFVGSFVSARNQPAVSCVLKASEGSLYPLEKAFLFVSKAPVYIPFTEVQTIEFARVGGRTFDVNVQTSSAEYQFSGVNSDERINLEEYLRGKNLKIRDSSSSGATGRGAADTLEASDAEMLDAEDADEDSSEDEDFDASGVSDDFDGDDSESSEGESGSEDYEADSKPPSKKPKTE